ncbi:acetate/propionate family kinase, partial [Pseudomonas aeruginosa]|nr:acetate/propionate family kinase [Pseudomonas aeruginosa]
MGTRCGDLDPGVPGFVARALGLTLAQIEAALYSDSGLKGLSGESSDLRIVEKRAGEGVGAAQLAMQVHAYRVRKYIGAYAAAMGGCD